MITTLIFIFFIFFLISLSFNITLYDNFKKQLNMMETEINKNKIQPLSLEDKIDLMYKKILLEEKDSDSTAEME